ncbi:MAG: heavy metal translocating P-type ATPase metal-binding domain-containing protein, partial [Phycisphaerae bacterium]
MSTSTVSTSPESARAQTEAILCAHCRLPVPAGLVEPDASHQFCCSGCQTVWEILHACGMERYYALRAQESAAETKPSPATGRAYAECDDPAYQKLHVHTASPAAGGSLCEVEFYLEGVHCAACVWLVERLGRVVPGVIETRLNLGKRLVTVRWDPAHVRLSRIAAALDSLGYPPHPARLADQRALRQREDRGDLIRIGIAGACAGNAMLVAIALYAGGSGAGGGGMEPMYTTLFRYVSMGLGLVSLTYPGRVFFRGGWAALRTRTPHLDAPIALGLLAGGIAGVINTVLGRGETYFDSLTVLVFLLLIGRFLQQRQQRRADDAVEALYCLTPGVARRIEQDPATSQETCRPVPIEALAIGDLVEVRANESIPVDAIIVAPGSNVAPSGSVAPGGSPGLEGSSDPPNLIHPGESSVDQALLTGESRPIRVAPGSPVFAGTLNLAATLRMRVTAAGAATRVGKLMALVAQGARNKAPMVLLADRISGYFLAIVITLAAATLGYWLWRGSALAADHAVALLIVACPCALGLATPLAMGVALGRAAQRGILIKGGAALEHLAAREGTIYLDKTGTLTMGQKSLVSWEPQASSTAGGTPALRNAGVPPAV